MFTPTDGNVLFIISNKMYKTGEDIKLTQGDNIGIHIHEYQHTYYKGEFLGVKSSFIYIRTNYGAEIGFELSNMALEIEPLD